MDLVEISSENGATDAFAGGPAAAVMLAVEASSTPARRLFKVLRRAELPKLGRAAASNNNAATAQKKAQTHAETAAAPSDRQLVSSPRLLAGAAPSSQASPEQRVAARAANPKNAASVELRT